MSEQRQVRVSKETRKPFGTQTQKLAYEGRPGYHRHWFNDEGDRIESALAAGYTHVEDKQGRKVQKVVGVGHTGGALTGFLMEIPEEWWKEDQARKQANNDAMDEAIRAGRVSQTQGDNRYVPTRGIKYDQGRRR